jgi:hypothetical protein
MLHPSHWLVTPEADARTWINLAARGMPARGHTRLAPCPACAVEVARDLAQAPAKLPSREEVLASPSPERAASLAIVAAGARVREAVSDAWGSPALIPVEGLTVRRILLVAARDVALATAGERVSATDLVLRAWALAPERFGLAGAERYPDSNRVLAKLSGADGLCGLGWLRRVEPGVYRVTDAGRAELRRIRHERAEGSAA